MKPLVNPLLLLACILLMASGALASGESGRLQFEGWVLALCLVAFLVNGALALARALSRYPSFESVGWSVIFFIFGGAVWVLLADDGHTSVSSLERATLRQRMKNWQEGGDPYAMDENGDSVLLLAAGLGKEKVLARLLQEKAGALAAHEELYAAAAMRAAERNQVAVLRQLAAVGVPVDARVEGMTPLHAAVLNQAHRSAACLLEMGAPVNVKDIDGATPLHHAVLAEDHEMVLLLMQHGADPDIEDEQGRKPASYAHDEEMESILAMEEVLP